MTLREAFDKAEWGDFLHRPSHGSSRWSKAYFAGIGSAVTTLSALADDWQVIPAPMNFTEALGELAGGKAIRRRGWDRSFSKEYSFRSGPFYFNPHDVAATDWEVVED